MGEENLKIVDKESLTGHQRKMEFVKTFFKHTNWYYAPVIFRLNKFRFEPDFYDNERGVFIEVVGTRQGFSANKMKYIEFFKTFPHLKFEIRRVDGSLIDPYILNFAKEK